MSDTETGLTRRRLLGRSGAVLAGLALASRSGSADDAGVEGSKAARGPSEAVQRLVEGNTAFAADLHRRLVDRTDESNLLTSPYSISSALAMVYAGARNQTKAEMRETLHFAVDEPAIHRAFQEIDQTLESHQEAARKASKQGSESKEGAPGAQSPPERSLPATPGSPLSSWLGFLESIVGTGAPAGGNEGDASGAGDGDDGESGLTLEVANAIWGQEGYPFSEAYLSVLEKHYGAGVHEVEFDTRKGREDARSTINGWTAENTNGKIEKILPKGSLSKRTRFVLTNAIYLNGDWKHPFEEKKTQPEPFTALDGTEREVPAMRQRQELPYAAVGGDQVVPSSNGDGVHQVVELPYVGSDVSMVVILPAEGEFESFTSGLTGDQLQSLTDRLSPREGYLQLPKFTYRSKFNLSKDLPQMGMRRVFSRQSDLWGMVDRDELPPDANPLAIAEVFHKTFVEVDEKGAEAAGATAVVGYTTTSVGSPEPQPFRMVVDRPFLFAIRDRETGTVLFLGQVADAAGAQDSG